MARPRADDPAALKPRLVAKIEAQRDLIDRGSTSLVHAVRQRADFPSRLWSSAKGLASQHPVATLLTAALTGLLVAKTIVPGRRRRREKSASLPLLSKLSVGSLAGALANAAFSVARPALGRALLKALAAGVRLPAPTQRPGSPDPQPDHSAAPHPPDTQHRSPLRSTSPRLS
jgi:hypothetical protein